MYGNNDDLGISFSFICKQCQHHFKLRTNTVQALMKSKYHYHGSLLTLSGRYYDDKLDWNSKMHPFICRPRATNWRANHDSLFIFSILGQLSYHFCLLMYKISRWIKIECLIPIITPQSNLILIILHTIRV